MASCEVIARECPNEDGKPVFRFDPVTRCWMQAPAPGCEDDGEWASKPVLVGGVEYWEMGDGYCWDEVGLDAGDWRTFYLDGNEDRHPEFWPLPIQAFVLSEIWQGSARGCFTRDGVTYSWD